MEEILIIDDSEQICSLLAEYVLPELGYSPVVAHTGRQGLQRLRSHLPDMILLDLQLPDISGLDLLRLIAQEGYDVPVILMTAHGSESIAVEAFRLGARNYLIKPFSDSEAKIAIDQALRERRLRREKERLTTSLQQRVQELTVLYRIGKSVTALMDQEKLLERIVEAGVFITQAEEGFLLLRDAATNELYLRAAKNLGEQRAQSLRLPIEDTLAGQVVRTGKPVRMDRQRNGSPLKVKTGFLVSSILQVPLLVGDTVIGVLAVDNQESDRVFTENDQYLLATLADYAAIAIENARLYDQVKQSEERYKELFANAYDMIFLLDRNLKISSANRATQQIIGFEASAIIGQSIQSLCVPESWEQTKSNFYALLAGQAMPPFEMEVFNHEHESVVLEVSAQVMLSSGKAVGLHCIARDLTERRRLEQQLVQSEKLSAVGQLVAGVAHELNNPLTSVSGYAQFLLRDPHLTPDSRQDVEQIHTQAERAGRIVRNLLVFAREHKPERTMVAINDVLRSTLALQSYQLRVDNILVNTAYEPELPPTMADPHQLQQVFLNLITNARHAMIEHEGKGTLTLRTRLIQTPNLENTELQEPLIEIAISDTGVGIPESNLRKIFNPFYTTKPVGQGTGLGLSICFGIVKEHGGRIWAESVVGQGTTVLMTIPVREMEAEIAHEPPPPSPDANTPSASYHILVADDEESVLRLMNRLLRTLGHRPLVVPNGETALEAIEHEHFDLVLSDIKMPGLNGFELATAIRERNPDLAERIIFFTGDTISTTTREQLEQTGKPYITKPFSIEQLDQAIKGLLKRRSLGQS